MIVHCAIIDRTRKLLINFTLNNKLFLFIDCNYPKKNGKLFIRNFKQI